MRSFFVLLSLFFLSHHQSIAQSYTLWSTGNATDTITNPTPCILLMGGATEDDQAMTRFLQYADHGDIVVIRTSGSDGYNDYLYADLGVQVHSVQTLLIPSIAAANDSFVVQTVRNAEALWIAGGDQWTYVSNWKNTPLNTALNHLINVRKVPIGGTSAGMAVLSDYYNSAQVGSAQSATVLANPYDATVTIGNSDFLNSPLLLNTITDTHFDDPDRRGRMMTFLARTWKDKGVKLNGIACDEYTAVFIDTNQRATVFGGKPSYDDNAYFIQVDCAGNNSIETCLSGSPLQWKQDSTVVKVYRIQSDSTGLQYFDLRNFSNNPMYTNNGGTWLDWWVENGTFNSKAGLPLACIPAGISEQVELIHNMHIRPNPFTGVLYLEFELGTGDQIQFSLTDMSGKRLAIHEKQVSLQAGFNRYCIAGLEGLSSGMYQLTLQSSHGLSIHFPVMRE